jgi:FAD:protein FMN transferase
MKIWLVTICLLLAAVGAVYVVWTVVLTDANSVGDRYDIPEGRYGVCMLVGQMTVIKSFPTATPREGPMPLPPKADVEMSTEVLGRTFTVGVYHKDANLAKIVAQTAIQRIEKIAAMADPSSSISEISRINKDAATKAVTLSDDMYCVLKRAMEVSTKSKGAFDVTVGPVRKLWLAAAESGKVPSPEEIEEARQYVGNRNLQMDDKKHTLRFTKKGVVIDLTDLIAGFALDQAAYELRRGSIKSGYVRCGDLWRLLDHPQADEERTWTLGIPDPNPAKAGRISRIVNCGPGAFVTKGTYSGSELIHGTAVNNLVDPLLGTCVGNIPVCSVAGPDAMTCDALATAFINSSGAATLILERFNPKEEEKEAPKKPEPEN